MKKVLITLLICVSSSSLFGECYVKDRYFVLNSKEIYDFFPSLGSIIFIADSIKKTIASNKKSKDTSPTTSPSPRPSKIPNSTPTPMLKSPAFTPRPDPIHITPAAKIFYT